jgi:hypothetical protein
MLIIMEHTRVYHLKLANYLYENDYQVAVVNPFSIKKFVEAKMSRVKTRVFQNSRKLTFLLHSKAVSRRISSFDFLT